VFDQQALVLLLREHQQVREWAQPLSHFTESGASDLFAADPQICGGELQPPLDHCICEADLAIELERARMDDDRPRCCSRLLRLVDDTDAYTQARQPEGQNKAGRARPHDQDLGFAQRGRPNVGFPQGPVPREA
jgi:hypothetical protein